MPEFEPLTDQPDTPRAARRLAGRWEALPGPLRAGIALATVVAAVFAAGTAGQLSRQSGPAPQPATRFDLALPAGPVLDLPGRVTGLELTADGGVALASHCAAELCRHSLGVRVQGRWRARTLPAAIATGPRDQPIEAVLLKHTRILVRTPHTAWFSRDAGRTWRPAPDSPPPVSRAAHGGRLVVVPVQGRGRTGGRVGVISYHTGGTALLARQPGLQVTWVAAQPDQTGRYWVTGTDPATGQIAVASSADDGATWRVEPLPGTAEDVTGAEVAWSGARRYAVTLAGRYPGRNLVRALYTRQPDGWHVTTRWPAANLLAVRGEPVARHDGSLLAVAGAGAVLISRDGGMTFSRTGGRLRLGPVTRNRHGWVVQVQDVTYPWLYSVDGFTWRRLPVG